MTSPLNPQLYEALSRAFGPVLVAHDGARMEAAYLPDCTGALIKRAISPGEYYRVNCFACGDTRHRLWVNHMWGVRDPRTGTRHRWAAKCFNEDCLRRKE